MRLSETTDHTLRVLMFCATHVDRRLTIREIAEGLQLSRNPLMKIVNDLARQGVLETTRGRGGGLRLGRAASEIRIGDVVRASETDFRLAECFQPETDRCTLTPGCALRGVLWRALSAWLAELDATTLADLVRSGSRAPRLAVVQGPAPRARSARP